MNRRTYPHRRDLELIPFDLGPARNRGSFELTTDLARHDGILFGGTGVAASVMAMEAVPISPAGSWRWRFVSC